MAGVSNGIRASRNNDGVRSAIMSSLHLSVGVASVVVSGPALAQQATPASAPAATSPGASGDVFELPTVEVGTDGAGTGFLATQSGVARIPVPLIDLPQQVNVVTEEVIREQNATTLDQALRNVSGITFSAGEGGQQGDNPIIRGFSARGDIFRDGIRDPGWYTRDMFNIEAVEVFMGPSSFAFGRGSTGGAINLVSKLPQDKTFAEIDVTGYTSPGWRATLDANGVINDKVAARITAMGQDVATAGRNNVEGSRWGVAPSVTVDLSDQTSVTLSYFFQQENGVPDYGVPYLPAPTLSVTPGAGFGQPTGGYYGNGQAVGPVPVPRENWYGITNGPLKDNVATTTNMATLFFEHEINEFVTVTNGTRYTTGDRLALVTAPRTLGTSTNNATVPSYYPVPLMTIGRQRFQTETDGTQLTNITDMVAKFDWGGWKHTMNAGLELTNESRYQQRYNYCSPTNVNCRTSLWAPVDVSGTGGVGGYPSFYPSSTNTTNMTDVAFYFGDQIKINDYFEVMGTARWDVTNSSYKNLTNSNAATNVIAYSALRNDVDLFNYRLGAVYHPVKNTSIYIAYGTSANPSAEYGVLTNDTATLAPETNETLEAGIKSELFNGKLVLSAAAFRTIKTNTRVPTDPTAGLPPVVLGGEQRVQGFSLGATGAITDKWNITASFTHLDSEILTVGDSPTLASLATVGKQLPNTPPNSFTLWTSYQVTDQLLVGGGLNYNDTTFANTNNTVYVPSYVTFDAMASYQFTKNFALQFNIYNLTDELYYAQYYGGHAVPAAGRYASLTARTTF